VTAAYGGSADRRRRSASLRARPREGSRCCRVQPDLLAVERAFDYLVPDKLAGDLAVGTIVRVPLHGRRVRGWIIADDITPATSRDRLLTLAGVVSAGPPAEVVALCEWAAWRWAGPLVPLLRAASPATVVSSRAAEVELGLYAAPPVPDRAAEVVATARGEPRTAVAWPPAFAREDLALALLADEGSSVVVMPDPSRSGALVRRLGNLGREVVVLHAALAPSDRSAAWDRARAGACVVVGGRIAVLAPVPDLAALVVLDEGDERLAEERVPTWNAREIAVERGARASARVALVGPAPTLSAEVHTGPPRRPGRGVERAGWPRLEIVDRRDEPPRAGLVSDRLAQVLRAAIGEGGRAVCVLNRRGRSRLLACARCGELARCPACGAAMAEDNDQLGCRRGDPARARVCLRCGGTRFRVLRPGVTHVRDEVAGLLPRATVTEVDAASGRLPPTSVYVGTEAALHRVPADEEGPVLLVTFLDFDQELLAPRYRAAEQALFLLACAARLLPPGGGRLLVQTRIPDHEVIRAARTGNPDVVAAAERPRRRAAGLPPFGGLAEVTGAAEAVAVACDALVASPELDVLGPDLAGSGSRALIRAPSPAALADALANIDLSAARAVGRLRVAVDPLRV
jgi:primosomal protein N' (replication factor Y) (superfamily II helicase)